MNRLPIESLSPITKIEALLANVAQELATALQVRGFTPVSIFAEGGNTHVTLALEGGLSVSVFEDGTFSTAREVGDGIWHGPIGITLNADEIAADLLSLQSIDVTDDDRTTDALDTRHYDSVETSVRD